LWLNGQAVADVESKKGEGLRELELESAAKPSKALKILKPGRNVAAVEVPLPDDLSGPFFELKIVIFEGTVLDLRAVVCDLCQLQPGELTACVKACPHEATRRFDARQGLIVW
jgi:Fe-S-cluster-containing hydrogenase component 2